MASSEELRILAVEAGKAEGRTFAARSPYQAAPAIVAATEPFIRELVVAEVVEWMERRANDMDPVGRGMAPGDWTYAAGAILAEFGGSR